MRKTLVFLIILLVFSIFSCTKLNNDYIYVGFVNSLDNEYGNLGVDSMYGTRLAVEEINENGGINGKQIKLVIKADDRNVEKAVEIDNNLKELGVVAIIGHGYSIMAEAITLNANSNDILLISPTIGTELISGLDDNFIRVTPSTKEQGYTLANAMHQETPGEVAIVYESVNLPFSINLVDSFIEKYEELGYTIPDANVFSFEINDSTGYQNIVDELENLGIANVLAVGSAFDIGNIMQKVDDISDYNFYLPAWTVTSDLLNVASIKASGAISISFHDFESNDYDFVTISDNFKQEYGLDISYSALLSYEAMYLLYDALKSTDDWSTSGLKEAIISKGTYEGITGNYIIDEYGDALRTIYYFRIDEMDFVTLGSDSYA